MTNYDKYLASDHWQKLKRRVYRKRGGKCEICGKMWALEAHHVNYKYNNTNQEINYIKLVCHTHHILCHWGIFGKIPMTPMALTKRFNQLKRQTWRRLRPSHILGILDKIFDL